MFAGRRVISSAVGVKHLNASTRVITRSLAIQKVGVIGLGLMGHGVAQMAAQAGYQVVAVEAQAHALELGYKR